MKKMHKRGTRILVMVLVFAILCTSLPCTPTIPVHAAQTEKNGTWYEVSARINASWGEHITGAIMVTNVSSQTKRDWQIAFPWQAKISSMWNGRYEETDDGYLITPLEYNAELAPEASVSLGFTAEGEDSELSRLTEDGFFQEAGVSVTDAEERENMTPASSVDVTASLTEKPTAEPTTNPTEGSTTKPMVSPTEETTPIPTVSPTEEPTVEPMVCPTEEPIPSPTVEPTPIPTVGLTEEPTVEPTVSPTAEPTVSPTEKPTASPTAEPTVSPTEKPTASPTEEPTPSPTIEPIPTADPTMEPAEDLYIYTDTTISEDIVCGNLFLMGGSLECNGYSITVQKDYFQNGGNLRLTAAELNISGTARIISGNMYMNGNSAVRTSGDFLAENAGNINLNAGTMEISGDLKLDGVNYFDVNKGCLWVAGDMDSAMQGSYWQNAGELSVGGNLTVSRGSVHLWYRVQAEIQGSLLLKEEGSMEFLDANAKPEVTVNGDVVIDTSEKLELLCGSLILSGRNFLWGTDSDGYLSGL